MSETKIKKYDWAQFGLCDNASPSQVKILCELYDKTAEYLFNETIHVNTKFNTELTTEINKYIETAIFAIIYRLVVKFDITEINIKLLITDLTKAAVKFRESLILSPPPPSGVDIEAEFTFNFCKGYAFNSKLSNMKNTVYEDTIMKKSTKFPKLLIIGHMRHGKDTLAEILNENFNLKFKSSSLAAAEIFIYDELKDKYGYNSTEECFEDRVNHRPEWYGLICSYNQNDRAKLAKGILQSADCYVGMRDRDEISECIRQGLFDLIIWVDASKRLPLESPDSFNIDSSCADIIIENNGTYEEFVEKAIRLGKVLKR